MSETRIKTIRIDGCTEDDHFRGRANCQRWLQQFLLYLTARLGTNITLRVNVYYAGCLHFCVDCYNENNASFVTTIALSSDSIRLYPPTGDQLDIVLPGIVDVFYLIRQVLAYTRKESGRISFLEVSLPDKPDAVQHAPEK